MDEALEISTSVWPVLSKSTQPERALASFITGVRDGALENAAEKCDQAKQKRLAAQVRAMKTGRPE